MNKKVVQIIVCVIVVIFVLLALIFVINRQSASSVGINENIQDENNKEGNTSLDSSKVLVVYFSETGNTQKLAKIISDEVGGDFRRIVPTKAYPTGDELFSYTEEEANNNERPTFNDLNVNMDDYDTIFIGYPIWWYDMPMIIYTFFDEYDLSGKTIIPFNTHEGSGDSGTYDEIKNLEPNASVLDGLAIRGGDMESDQTSNVRSWLEDLGF